MYWKLPPKKQAKHPRAAARVYAGAKAAAAASSSSSASSDKPDDWGGFLPKVTLTSSTAQPSSAAAAAAPAAAAAAAAPADKAATTRKALKAVGVNGAALKLLASAEKSQQRDTRKGTAMRQRDTQALYRETKGKEQGVRYIYMYILPFTIYLSSNYYILLCHAAIRHTGAVQIEQKGKEQGVIPKLYILLVDYQCAEHLTS